MPGQIVETSGPTAMTPGAIADGEFFKRSGATIIGGAGGSGGEEYWWRQVGTAVKESWYGAGFTTDRDPSQLTAFATDILRAMPFIEARGGTLDRLAFEVTTAGAAGSVARAGIYQAASATNLYPSALIVDGGQHVTTAAGIKASSISIALSPGTVYWFVYLCGVAAPTIRAMNLWILSLPIFGFPPTLGAVGGRCGLSVAQAYGALPATFPAGAADPTGTNPVLTARYSA